MYYNLFDSHSHSKNSPDGCHSITFMAETAVAKGLQGLSITDHCEGDWFDIKSYDKRIFHSAVGTAMAKSAFKNSFILTFGIEVAQVFECQDTIEKLLETQHFDFVIGSIHKLLYEDFDYFRVNYDTVTPEKLHEYNLKYYEEMIDLIHWGNFDVIGHLSFPVRFPKLLAGMEVDLTRYKESIDAVLKLAVDKGKGIEINTSGLRNAMNETLPPLWVLKRFRELGGEVVTIGSDAHKAEDLGEGIEHGMDLLSQAGFEYFAFFRDRKPVMLKII